jgi:hypothetical protein
MMEMRIILGMGRTNQSDQAARNARVDTTQAGINGSDTLFTQLAVFLAAEILIPILVAVPVTKSTLPIAPSQTLIKVRKLSR